MKQALLTVGKPSAAYIVQGLADYARRMKPFGGMELIHVRAAKATKNRGETEIMEEEAQRILARIDQGDMVWVMDVAGKAWTSRQWAQRLDKVRLSGKRRLVIVIGGHLGFAPAVLERADVRVCFGPQTMAHELASLVAAEQIYRACTIIAGMPYHRE